MGLLYDELRVARQIPPILLQRAGSLEAGMVVRAVDKNADFILLEMDADNARGGRQGVLGWADASCVVPAWFPAFYEFGSELPDAVRMILQRRVHGSV